jgi:sulfur carrier protein
MILVNGKDLETAPGERLSELLARLGVAADTQGVAVAVNGEVVPRGRWESFGLQESARVEVLSPMQGG